MICVHITESYNLSVQKMEEVVAEVLTRKMNETQSYLQGNNSLMIQTNFQEEDSFNEFRV